jgi:hypothetical protein
MPEMQEGQMNKLGVMGFTYLTKAEAEKSTMHTFTAACSY